MENGGYNTVCAFVGLDDTGKARYCSMRGTAPDSDIKQDKTGSDKSYPFVIELYTVKQL